MHILFASHYIHNLLKAFCSVPVISAGLQTALIQLKVAALMESAWSLIKTTVGHVAWATGLWIKTMFSFENGSFPCILPSPTVELCSHSRLSLTAIVSSTIKSRKKIIQHLSWAQPQDPPTHVHTHISRNTQKSTTRPRRMDVTIDFWADVRDIAQIQKPK